MGKTYRFVERSKTSLGNRRWVHHCSHLPDLGPAFWCAVWMSQEVECGYTATYHFNGHLIARAATYTGVSL